jgi:5'-nucleotidase (lipoprotein e(P4) family)
VTFFKVTAFSFWLLFITSCSSLVTPRSVSNPRDYQISSYLWFQTSGEFRALCYQAYNLAKFKLDRDLENKHNRKRAVVFDIDETVLDNSVIGAYEVKNAIGWNKDSFDKWVVKKSATAIAGARDFIEYAVSRRVEIIYISNRHKEQISDTYDNLKSLGIPAKKENFYFQEGDWSKEERRLEVLKKYDVVLYFGDNLHDFHKDWDYKSSAERVALVDKHHEDFGEKFIILPNPLYGDWEDSLPRKVLRTDLLKTIP